MKKRRVAVIGAGITGVAAARMMHGKAEVVVFEKNEKIGGLIRCDQLPEGLYHKLGGHVFNTKSPQVAQWFWQHFDRDAEFNQLTRDARILFGTDLVGYPLENHLYQLPGSTSKAVVSDLLSKAARGDSSSAANFKDALLRVFGPTLCDIYFFPYNEKIWRTDLATIPTGWLEGKLPMPDISEIITSNILRHQESSMVHAQFYYAKKGGSQFIIDRLAQGLEIRCSSPVERLVRAPEGGWHVNGDTRERFDQIISTADIRTLAQLVPEAGDQPAFSHIKNLRTRGITNVFCECDHTNTSWLYLPERHLAANRIIYTGAFSPTNNRTTRMTCVVEFVYGEDEETITKDLRALPGNLRRIAINHVRDAYVIQENDTRNQVAELKRWGRDLDLSFVGRFAEWEYYNIDKAIEAAMATCA